MRRRPAQRASRRGGGLRTGLSRQPRCRAPERMLLRRVQQQRGGVPFEQQSAPEAGGPGVPREDRGRVPVGEAEGLLAAVVCMAQGAGGALVAGEDSPAARQRFENLGRRRVRIIHLPFIRLRGLENRDTNWRSPKPQYASSPGIMVAEGVRLCDLRFGVWAV